jgi:hypothetical protein
MAVVIVCFWPSLSYFGDCLSLPVAFIYCHPLVTTLRLDSNSISCPSTLIPVRLPHAITSDWAAAHDAEVRIKDESAKALINDFISDVLLKLMDI